MVLLTNCQLLVRQDPWRGVDEAKTSGREVVLNIVISLVSLLLLLFIYLLMNTYTYFLWQTKDQLFITSIINFCCCFDCFDDQHYKFQGFSKNKWNITQNTIFCDCWGLCVVVCRQWLLSGICSALVGSFITLHWSQYHSNSMLYSSQVSMLQVVVI